MRPTNWTGRVMGACQVIGPAGEPRKWLTRCTRCGQESIRSSDALRTLKNVGGFDGCMNCRERITPRGLKPESTTEQADIDIGHVYQDGAGFRLTPLGRLQQDFYLGRMNRGAV